MKSVRILAIATLACAVTVSTAMAQGKKGPSGPGMTLTSPDFQDGAEIPNKYTQADQNPVKTAVDTAPPIQG